MRTYNDNCIKLIMASILIHSLLLGFSPLTHAAPTQTKTARTKSACSDLLGLSAEATQKRLVDQMMDFEGVNVARLPVEKLQKQFRIRVVYLMSLLSNSAHRRTHEEVGSLSISGSYSGLLSSGSLTGRGKSSATKFGSIGLSGDTFDVYLREADIKARYTALRKRVESQLTAHASKHLVGREDLEPQNQLRTFLDDVGPKIKKIHETSLTWEEVGDLREVASEAQAIAMALSERGYLTPEIETFWSWLRNSKLIYKEQVLAISNQFYLPKEGEYRWDSNYDFVDEDSYDRERYHLAENFDVDNLSVNVARQNAGWFGSLNPRLVDLNRKVDLIDREYLPVKLVD